MSFVLIFAPTGRVYFWNVDLVQWTIDPNRATLLTLKQAFDIHATRVMQGFDSRSIRIVTKRDVSKQLAATGKLDINALTEYAS